MNWPTSTLEQLQSQEPQTAGTEEQRPGSALPSSSAGLVSERHGNGGRT